MELQRDQYNEKMAPFLGQIDSIVECKNLILNEDAQNFKFIKEDILRVYYDI